MTQTTNEVDDDPCAAQSVQSNPVLEREPIRNGNQNENDRAWTIKQTNEQLAINTPPMGKRKAGQQLFGLAGDKQRNWQTCREVGNLQARKQAANIQRGSPTHEQTWEHASRQSSERASECVPGKLAIRQARNKAALQADEHAWKQACMQENMIQ